LWLWVRVCVPSQAAQKNEEENPEEKEKTEGVPENLD
jgi:hypothetical protein